MVDGARNRTSKNHHSAGFAAPAWLGVSVNWLNDMFGNPGYYIGKTAVNVTVVTLKLLSDSPAEEVGPLAGFKDSFNKIDNAFGNRLLTVVPFAVSGLITANTSYNEYMSLNREFREVVAYELGKKPEQIGFWDIFNSKNEIVREQVRSLPFRVFVRGGTDMFYLINPYIGAGINEMHLEVMEPIFFHNRELKEILDLAEKENNPVSQYFSYLIEEAIVNLYQHQKFGSSSPDYDQANFIASKVPFIKRLAEAFANPDSKCDASAVVYVLGSGMMDNLEKGKHNREFELILVEGLSGTKELLRNNVISGDTNDDNQLAKQQGYAAKEIVGGKKNGLQAIIDGANDGLHKLDPEKIKNDMVNSGNGIAMNH